MDVFKKEQTICEKYNYYILQKVYFCLCGTKHLLNQRVLQIHFYFYY